MISPAARRVTTWSIFLGPSPTDKNRKNYSLNIQMAPEGGSVSDPARLIGGWISYNVKFVAKLLAR